MGKPFFWQLGGLGGSGPPAHYQTNFDVSEIPISEGGSWENNTTSNPGWTKVITTGGLAIGTQSGFAGSGGYDDSYAYLSPTLRPFPNDYECSAVIHKSGSIGGGVTSEVEILLRCSDDPSNVYVYECNLQFNGNYCEIVKWPGPRGTTVGQFTYLAQATGVGPVNDGDVFKARIVGNVITCFLNGVQIATGTDVANSYPTGQPGIGFFWRNEPATNKFCFSSFEATGL